MPSLFCTQGHENAADSRFCRLCGEKLIGNLPAIAPQGVVNKVSETVVGLRYRIQCQLSSGGFGRTYLGNDLHRFNEPCVLKEFAPQVEGTAALQKAERLFEREAGVLYRLQHSQIPKFRELLRAGFEGRDRLFLVQDYIDGQTYQNLIEERYRQGRLFTEAEVTNFLTKILPVLQYIHSAGVIHRDIAPDNLILRTGDQMPVLIDFGGVKQAAFAAASELAIERQTPPAEAALTLLGKPGYAPAEQLQSGQAYPHSDLYALAVTVLVMLTGRSPQTLVSQTEPTAWQSQVNVSSVFRSILTKMLAQTAGDRYSSAREVLQALNAKLQMRQPLSTAERSTSSFNSFEPSSPFSVRSSSSTYTPTQAVPVRAGRTAASSSASGLNRSTPSTPGLGQIIGTIALVSGVALFGGWIGFNFLPNLLTPNSPSSSPPSSQTETESSGFSAAEQERKASIQTQRQQLGINESFLVSLTDASFYRQYPEQEGRALTDAPDDAEWRSRWDAIALEWLDALENTLSAQARGNLGSYDETDLAEWRQAVSQLYVSSLALYDLADAKFFQKFPDRRGTNFINQPIGQIWYGLADDELTALQSGQSLTRLRFADGAFGDQVNGRLQPGEGHVYIMGLTEGQMMRLNLQAPQESTQLSLYVPTPNDDIPYLLSDSADRVWAGQLPQTGFYEVVVVVTTPNVVSYQLRVTVDNVTSESGRNSD
jgi:serine/threonine-protein kinase